MIQVELLDSETEKRIATVKMHFPPSVGDTLWLQPTRDESSFTVVSVAHWVSDTSDYHKVCAYVSVV